VNARFLSGPVKKKKQGKTRPVHSLDHENDRRAKGEGERGFQVPASYRSEPRKRIGMSHASNENWVFGSARDWGFKNKGGEKEEKPRVKMGKRPIPKEERKKDSCLNCSRIKGGGILKKRPLGKEYQFSIAKRKRGP